MKLQEYQSKLIFAKYGVPIPEGDVATTPDEVRRIADRLGNRVVVKAQVLVGGRGKAGGIKLAADESEAEAVAGEILGIAGVSGNGQHELSEVLTGLRKATRGRAMLEANDLTECSARKIADLGVAHVPTERIRMGTVPSMSIRENLILKSYRSPAFSKWLLLDEKAAYENACKAMKEYEISAPHDGTAAKNLSGGNIQRMVLARELSGSPRFVVAAHPTYGLDVGATEQVRKVLLDQRDHGAAILLISEDLEEILQLSDRILVIYEGQVMGIMPAEGADVGEIGLMMAGSHRQEVAQ